VSPLRVLLAEDHAVVREGTRGILGRDREIAVVGEADDGPTAVALAARLVPDVVLLDLALPGFNGLEAARRIAALPRAPRVLILSAYEEPSYVRAAFAAGAHGYLPKKAHADEVVAAIRAVARGEIVLHPTVARHVMGSGDAEDSPPLLSRRQLEILRAAAEGERTRDIAARLKVSARTVEADFTTIFARLGVATRTEAVSRAATAGWLDRRDGSPLP